MKSSHEVAILAVAAALLLACVKDNPDHCDEARPGCEEGKVCDLPSNTCVPVEGKSDGGSGGGVWPDGGVSDVRGLADAADSETSRHGEAGPPSDGSASDGPVGDGPAGKVLGEQCDEAEECQSDACAHGVCCDSACDGACRSCVLEDKEGQCTLVPNGKDPHGSCDGTGSCGGSCNGEGACAFPDTSASCGTPACVDGQLSSGACNGAGACVQSSGSCGGYACENTTSCKTSCGGKGDCIADLVCAGSTCKGALPAGQPCGTNNELCGSGQCVDGVCCEQASCAPCHACNVSAKEGSCQPVAAAQPCGNPQCSDTTRTTHACDGAGSCVPSAQSCAPYICGASAACSTSCSLDAHCAPGHYCDGSQCRPEKDTASSCSEDKECKTNQCVDRVCCSAASCSECQACNVGGKEGSCAAIPDGTPPAGQCAHDSECGPARCEVGACKYTTGIFCRENCTNDTHTVFMCGTSGRCEPSQTSCGAMSCNDEREHCRTGGCITHAHCAAASACDRSKAHLSGEGFCIDPAVVLGTVNNPTELLDLMMAIEKLPVPETTRYILINPGVYQGVGIRVPYYWKLSVIGKTVPGQPVLFEDGNMELERAELTVQGVTITKADAYGAGVCLKCSYGGTLRAIEATVERCQQGVEVKDCNLEIRRSTVADSTNVGVVVAGAYDSVVIITNSLIYGDGWTNDYANGIAIRTYDAPNSAVLANNTIVSGNFGAAECYSSSSGDWVFRNSVLIGTWPDKHTSGEPCEREFSVADSNTGTCSLSDYRPSAAPCVNGGDNASAGGLKLDHDNNPRIQGGTVDVGAFEVQ